MEIRQNPSEIIISKIVDVPQVVNIRDRYSQVGKLRQLRSLLPASIYSILINSNNPETICVKCKNFGNIYLK